MLGSGLSQFALGVWLYQSSGSITRFALFTLCLQFPGFVAAPFAGTLVDKVDRRHAVLIADSVAALSMLAIAASIYTGRFEPWQVYVAVAVSSVSRAFQLPAFAAAVTTLVPREQLGRANGVLQMGEALGAVLGPLFGVVLVSRIGIEGVLAVDFATFLLAMIPLLLLRLPSLKPQPTSAAVAGPLREQLLFGWRYLVSRRLLVLLVVLEVEALAILGFMEVLSTPLMLAVADLATLGTFAAIAGLGMVLGSVVLAVSGGSARPFRAGRLLLAGFGIALALAGVSTWLPLMLAGGFVALFCYPFVIGSAHTLWQREVPQEVQGKVFATRSMFARLASSLAYLAAGPLAEHVFEPALKTGGALSGSVGAVMGLGPGRGIAVVFVMLGALAVATSLAVARGEKLAVTEH